MTCYDRLVSDWDCHTTCLWLYSLSVDNMVSQKSFYISLSMAKIKSDSDLIVTSLFFGTLCQIKYNKKVLSYKVNVSVKIGRHVKFPSVIKCGRHSFNCYPLRRRLPDLWYYNFVLALGNLVLFRLVFFTTKDLRHFWQGKGHQHCNAALAPASRLRGVIHTLIQSPASWRPITRYHSGSAFGFRPRLRLWPKWSIMPRVIMSGPWRRIASHVGTTTNAIISKLLRAVVVGCGFYETVTFRYLL